MTARQERIAVVSVHGVADQKPGDTARDIAALLQRALPGSPAFVGRREMVAVKSLGTKTEVVGSPWYSRLLRLPHSQFARQRFGSLPSAEFDLDFSRHMVSNHEARGDESMYATERLSAQVQEPGAGRDLRVDVFEMYWADLSRLGAGTWRILSEFYQIIFHLCSMGRHMVDMARIQNGEGLLWIGLSQTIAVSEAMLVGPIAMANLGLLLVALMLVPAIAFESQGHVVTALILAAYAIVVLYLAWAAWIRHRGLAIGAVGLCAGLAALAVWCAHARGSSPPLGGAAIAIASLPALTGLGYFVAISVGARNAGARRWAGVAAVTGVAVFLGHALHNAGEWGWPIAFESTVVAAARAAEGMFFWALLGWVVLIIAQIIYALFALSAHVRSYLGGHTHDQVDGLRAIRTGMLTMMITTSTFVVITISLWTLISNFKNHEALTHSYFRPWLYRWLTEQESAKVFSVSSFVTERLDASAVFFAPTVICLAILAVALLIAVLPALVAEIRPPAGNARSISMGRWLDDGLKGVSVPIVMLTVVYFAAILVYLLTAVRVDAAAQVTLWFKDTTILQYVGYAFAASATSLFVIGRGLSDTLGKVRVVLDTVLDIDNYFREFPRDKNPRSRIYARYVAMLRYLSAQPEPYDRIVIVAHSQGTVITADLLRLVSSPQHEPQLDLVNLPPLTLLSAGCPLAQLYRVRFAHLYRWIDADNAQWSDLRKHFSLTRWINVYRSGDYVGRALWRGAPRYEPEQTPHPVDSRRAEMCLGEGAHTHYFDPMADDFGRVLVNVVMQPAGCGAADEAGVVDVVPSVVSDVASAVVSDARAS
jgi:hypothetical protein